MNEETNRLLKELLKWQKFHASELLKKKVKTDSLFVDEKHILVYFHSDGSKSSREIEKLTGIGYKTVQSLWKKWILSGIAEPSEKYKGKQCNKLFELHEIGLELPKKEDHKNDVE